MKVKVYPVGHGEWQWAIVAGNGTAVAVSASLGPRKRMVEQAERVAGPLHLVVVDE